MVDRRFGKPQPDPYVRAEVFTIQQGKHKGAVLQSGDWFRFFNEEGVYRFKYAVTTPSGSQFVSAYGGSKDPNGINSWRSWPFDAEFIPTKSKRKET